MFEGTVGEGVGGQIQDVSIATGLHCNYPSSQHQQVENLLALKFILVTPRCLRGLSVKV